MKSLVSAGFPEPLGVTPTATGVNVAISSGHATAIDFCLFDQAGETEIARFTLPERSGDVWHGHIAGIAPGARYGLRAHGPYAPLEGHRFNPCKLLVDPHATLLDRPFRLHAAMFGYKPGEWDLSFSDTDSAPFMPKAIVTAPAAPLAAHAPARPWQETILYELNVRGFSKLNGAIPEQRRGTFAGLAHRASLDHLTGLGITTVEIMPAAAWIDERHLGPLGLTNAWGYNPAALMAPEPKLAPGGWADIRAAVEALHAAGIEVIVDVVLNHTGEGDELGPTLSLRGLDNAGYYRLNPDNPARYIDDMGCGNCLALDRPAVVRLAMDALRTWVRRAGIDGFRFDLAPALGRRPEGFDPAAPLIAAIAQDPELNRLKLIAEPWDIGPGGYQVGRFPAGWAEWNDRYRDDVRRFWRGDSGMTGALATRLAGSADLFGPKGAARSINFVTAHDGFTLADLVAHRQKHNLANGEDNRDGTGSNHSWNHGIEGPSDDPAITAARRRDQINLLATLLLSRGIPMLQMGAEIGHSQAGNNNAYAQDNALTWLNWESADPELLATTRALIALRKRLPVLAEQRFLTGAPRDLDAPADAEWLRSDGAPMQQADWSDPQRSVLLLALGGDGLAATRRVLIVLNRGDAAAPLALPQTPTGYRWEVVLDTSRPAETASGDLTPAQISPRAVLVVEEVIAESARRALPAPAADATIDRLAAAVGIAPEYWEVSGAHHRVGQATKRALLAALSLDVSSQASARDALDTLAETRDRRRLPETAHGREGRPLAVPLALAGAPDRAPASLTLIDEAGGKVGIACTEPAFEQATACDTRRFRRAWIELPRLAAGRYRLLDERAGTTCRLTIAPHHCFPLPEEPRFGISAQLYTLRHPGDQGIGDMTTLARTMQAAGATGARVFGINPLHALFPLDRSRVSPYHPSDRRFIDPVYIDVTALADLPTSPLAEAMLAAAEPEFAALRSLRSIDYPRVSALKLAILKARFEAFRTAFFGGDSLRRDFLDFAEQGGAALDAFATFRLLEARFEGQSWRDWPEGLDRSGSQAVRGFAEANRPAITFEIFLQWLADRQLRLASEAGRVAGVDLYRDLAVGCAPDGAEAWAGGRQLMTGVTVGAPPDPFSATGQVWNLPPLNPLTMAEDGFAGWRGLLAANMRHAGLLRIDHVMGLTRLFCIPAGAEPSEGAYIGYPRDALLAELALESQRRRCAIVGEDLGTVPDGFREALADNGVLSYRVVWFERDGEEFRDPASYPTESIACAATHDLPTLAGWWLGRDIDEQHGLGLIADPAAARAHRRAEKQRLAARLVAAGLIPRVPDLDGAVDPGFATALHGFVARAPSRIAFAQADDLAGEETAVNLPGTDRERDNWLRRLDVDGADLFRGPLTEAILSAVGAGRGGTISLPIEGARAKETHASRTVDPAAATARADNAGP